MQPQRGLIVDDTGRPLVANRTSWWSRSTAGARQVDASTSRRAPRAASPTVVDVPAPRIQRALVTCGDEDPSRGLLERLAVPAGPGGRPTSSRTSPCASSSSPRTSRRCRRAAERARLPTARQASTWPTSWATSARSPRRSSTRPRTDERHLAQRRLDRRSRRAIEASSTTAGCAACPATRAWRSTRWAGCWATTARSPAQPGDTLVTSHRRQGAGRGGAAARRHHRAPGLPATR